MEKDPIRGNDSFNTFEEILQLAKSQEVDLMLLGGDLFHENKPSRSTMYRTMELLRRYCLGDRPVSVEILSDQSLNFHTKFGCVNYEDPNYNVEIPVFSIHGNHDDPGGDGRLAALDILSVSNLVNYFGKSDNIDDVTIYPILMKKGSTKLALYGMGNIRDERLYRTFQQKKVKLMRPVESRDEWFNLLVLHQNRAAHSPKNHVHESMLEGFLDFIVWGHEHECLISPQASTVGEFYISQPGSSVATALSDGEAKKKYVGILEIHNGQFRLKPIALQTVRPFVLDDIVLSSEEVDLSEPDQLIEFLSNKIEEMISKSLEDLPPTMNKATTKPLIRLKVEYSGGFSTINPQRFGQRFVGRVANPNDILLFHRKRNTTTHTSKKAAKDAEKDLLMRAMKPDPLDNLKMEDLIQSFLVDTSKPLEILPENDLNSALSAFVDKDDKSAISEFVNKTLSATRNYLRSEDPEKTIQPDVIQTIVSERTAQKRLEDAANSEAMDEEKMELIKQIKTEKQSTKGSHSDEEDQEVKHQKRKHKESSEEEQEEEEEEEEELKPKKTKAKSKSKAKKSTAKKTTTKKTTSKGKKKKGSIAPLEIVSVKNEASEEEHEEDKVNEVVESEEEDKPVVIEDNTSSQSVAKRRITSITDIFSEPKKSKHDASSSSSSSSSQSTLDVKSWGKKKKQ